MLKAFRHNIAPLLSLFLAIYFLNFSVDAPKIKVKNSIGTSEVENIIALILDIDLDLKPSDSSPEDCQKEVEKEASSDAFDIFHGGQSVALAHVFNSSLLTKYAHQLAILGRAMDIISPPPKC